MCKILGVISSTGHLMQESISIYALLRGLGPAYSTFNVGITSNLHHFYFEDVVAQINSHDELLTFTSSSRDPLATDFLPIANQA
ncbi:unnamed protein product [Spirodela intermedia]|uniref:Uncharacterized protein n=1 Tax=Spirodela intermedia TaxID=51605 RepID=A0A7I8JDK6_SPIIN|nr:unnamed protein product [Spirodela intermedia]CAA6668091.1 unnamed protein product [Spirodela intermedia]